MEAIRQVIYISQATQPMEREDIEESVATAGHNNKQLGITGAVSVLDHRYLRSWLA